MKKRFVMWYGEDKAELVREFKAVCSRGGKTMTEVIFTLMEVAVSKVKEGPSSTPDRPKTIEQARDLTGIGKYGCGCVKVAGAKMCPKHHRV